MNKTVLSDEVRQEIKHRYFQGIANNTPVCLTELTEQAVLQSPEIQQIRKAAERYLYIKKGTQWIVAATQTGVQLDGEELDDLIDSEME